MVKYAMAIDLAKCMGCQACAVACKAENELPLGVYRTRIEERESGTYPNVSVSIVAKQCMHCDDPPCVKVCPTQASYRTDDGIVHIDRNKCIGCKACMIACPYDARRVNEEERFVDKCTFCDTRVEQGLLPACVETCPTSCRIFGDLDDANSDINQVLQHSRVDVLKPELGTRPKFFYLNSLETGLGEEADPDYEQSKKIRVVKEGG